MRKALAAWLVTALPTAALAGGMDYPDNGTEALGRGGAFVAKADDGTAIYYNPAGLSQLSGLRLTVDANFVKHNILFQRQTPGGGGLDAPAGQDLGTPVENIGGVYIAPIGALSYGFAEGPLKGLTIAVGGYGPPSVGRYQYNPPDPGPAYYRPGPGMGRMPPRDRDVNGAASTDPAAQLAEDTNPAHQDLTSQNRYQLLKNEILIVYPTLAASYRVTDWLSVGASGQYVYSDVSFSQVAWNYPSGHKRDVVKIPGATSGPGADVNCPTVQREPIEAGPCAFPNDQLTENTYWDATADVNATGHSFTGIVGVLVGPFRNFSFGASFRPPVELNGEGTLTTERTKMMDDFEVTVDGNTTTLDLTLAPVARLGARYDLKELLGRTADVELDYVWEGWSVVDEIVVKPDVTTTASADFVKAGNNGEPIVTKLPEIHIQKGWSDVHGLRFGGEVEVMDPVTVRAGYIYETNAIPTRTASLDFVNFGDRHVLTAGLSVRPIRFLDLAVAYAHVFQPTTTVTDSEVRQLTTDPEQTGNVVGNGVYESSYDLITAGVTLRFSQL